MLVFFITTFLLECDVFRRFKLPLGVSLVPIKGTGMKKRKIEEKVEVKSTNLILDDASSSSSKLSLSVSTTSLASSRRTRRVTRKTREAAAAAAKRGVAAAKTNEAAAATDLLRNRLYERTVIEDEKLTDVEPQCFLYIQSLGVTELWVALKTSSLKESLIRDLWNVGLAKLPGLWNRVKLKN